MTGLDGFDPGDVEGGIDTHSPWKLEVHSDRVDDFGN